MWYARARNSPTQLNVRTDPSIVAFPCVGCVKRGLQIRARRELSRVLASALALTLALALAWVTMFLVVC